MTIRLGAFSKPDSVRRASTAVGAINKLEQILWGNTPSRRFGAQRIYYESWGDRTSFPDARMTDAISKNRVPVMSITPPNDTYVNVTAGNHDSQIVEWATGLGGVSLPHGVGYICFNHEADLKRVRYGSGGATHQIVGPQYVAAFRHIIDIFRANGVSDAGWRYGIILTQAGYDPSVANYWYLGDSYTNSTDGFIGADGYNWYPCKSGSQPREFTVVMDRFWTFAAPKKTANGCHLLLGEVGCQEYDAFDEFSNTHDCSGFGGNSATAKRDWINNMRDACKTTHSALDVLCWFDSHPVDSYGWWLDTRAITTTAFANMGNDPFFLGGSSNNNIVTVPLATATASAPVPSISLPGSVRKDAPTASASATALTPSITGTTGGTGGGGGGGTPTGAVQLLVGA